MSDFLRGLVDTNFDLNGEPSNRCDNVCDPLVVLKADLIRLIANLAYENTTNQDIVSLLFLFQCFMFVMSATRIGPNVGLPAGWRFSARRPTVYWVHWDCGKWGRFLSDFSCFHSSFQLTINYLTLIDRFLKYSSPSFTLSFDRGIDKIKTYLLFFLYV